MTIEELYQIYLQHSEVTTDSRQCPEGSMFFALKGPSFDGNQFARAALEKGCAVAVVDSLVPTEGEANESTHEDKRIVLVDDVLSTLQQLAAHHRRQLQIPVLQITGTNGKTTTKELVSAVLAKRYNVLFTQGNLNNHIGVPRTLLRLRPEHEIAVVETGANHPGEIAQLSQMVQADYGLITNVGRAHLEGFGSFEGVKRTKGELYDDLARRGKTAFLNAFDEDLLQMAHERPQMETIHYVEGRVSKVVPFLEVQWRAADDQPWHTVQTRLVGGYNIANVRAAISVGLHFGVAPELIDQALREYTPTNSRSEFRQTERNRLIVDAYNANPTSMAAALQSFQFVEDADKMIILGEMRELGDASPREHAAVLHVALQSDAKHLWFVGENFRAALKDEGLATGTSGPEGSTAEAGRVRFFANVDEVKAELAAHPITHRTILIKGSNGTKLYLLPDLL